MADDPFTRAARAADRTAARLFDRDELRVVAKDDRLPPFPVQATIDRTPHFQASGADDRAATMRIAILAHRAGWLWTPDRGDRFESQDRIYTILVVDEAASDRPCFWVAETIRTV